MSDSIIIRNLRRAGYPSDSRHTVTITDGKICSIKSDRDSRGTASYDANGGWLYPGFVDGHLHLTLSGQMMSNTDLNGVASRDEFESRIAEGHRNCHPDSWLIAQGWLESDWGGDPMPTMSWLAATGDRPTVCWKRDHHAILVNAAVIDLLDDKAECPPGGEIVRDHEGNATGLMLEAAAWHLINPMIPKPPVEIRQQSTIKATQHLATLGIVAVGSMEYASEIIDVLDPIRDELAVRVMATMLDRELPIHEALQRLTAIHNDDHLALIGCKAFLDGTFGSRTAAMLQPFADDPENTGTLVELAQRGEVHEWIERVIEAGLSPSMHAIGDHAARLALDAGDHADNYARTSGLAQQLIRIEHCQTVDPEDIARFAGRIASMQPIHARDDGRIAVSRLGPERLAHFFPTLPLATSGATLAFGSDWPIADPDPMKGIQAALDGADSDGVVANPNSRIDLTTALDAYTSGARAALGMADVCLSSGDPADIVITDRPLDSVDWTKDPPSIHLTVCGGKVTYDHSQKETSP